MEKALFEKIAIILLVNILFYCKTIKFGYVSDDVPSSQRPKEPNKWIHAFWVLEGKLKSTPEIDHATTILLHSIVCVGVYIGFGASSVSFLAALLFALNPINNQGSCWISGRGYVLSALGMVWALALPIELGGLMLLGATYSNAGFIMPVVLIGSNHPGLLIFMPLVWMFHVKNFRKNVVDKMNMEVFTEDAHIHPKKLILATKTFGFYLSHSLIPIKTTFYHSLLESIAGCRSHKAYNLCRFFWFGAFSIGAMLFYICTHKWDMVCFGILWWCIGIAPFLNLYRMQQELGERYSFLPNVGLMIVLASFIYTNPYLVSGFLMMYATKMWFYMDSYKDDFWLIEHARINSPDSWFAWHIAALKRWDVKSHAEAINFWVMAKSISPKEFKILFNLAAALAICGNKTDFQALLAEAEANIPKGQEKQAGQLIADFRQGKVAILV